MTLSGKIHPPASNLSHRKNSLDAKRLSEQDEIVAELSAIPAMALVTLFSRAIESQSPEPILNDEYALAICERLQPALAASPDGLKRSLSQRRLAPILYRHIALRTCFYDQIARSFMHDHPGATVVNLGCGLDTRFHRIDDRRAIFFDLDLPEMIVLKSRFVEQNPRYRLTPKSIFDYSWMDRLEGSKERPILFLAEGVFIYLEANRVKNLVLTLQQRFPGSELLCEVFNSRWLGRPFKPLVNWFLRRITGLGKHADYHFGLKDSREMEGWGTGIELIHQWTYFDPDHPKLRQLRWFGKLKIFRKLLWTVHYRFS